MAGPCLLVNITEKGRLTLAMALAALNVVSVLLALAMMGCGAYIKLSIEEKINLIGDYNNDILPWVLVGLGGLSIITGILGALATTWCQDLQQRSKVKGLLLPFISVTFFLAICIFASALLTFAQIAHVHSGFGIGIGEAMRKYKYEKEIKQQIDGLQIRYSCCGMKSYEDWFKVSWIHEKFLNTSSNVIKSKLVQGEYYNDDAPFSCCDPTSVRPCVHHHVMHNDVHFHYDYRTAVSLFTRGCRDALAENFKTLLINCGALITAIFSIQIILIVCMRYLQTSISKAYELGDPTLDAPGWMFGPFGKEDEENEDNEDNEGGEETGLLKGDMAASGSDEDLFVRQKSGSILSGRGSAARSRSAFDDNENMDDYVTPRRKSTIRDSPYRPPAPPGPLPGVPAHPAPPM